MIKWITDSLGTAPCNILKDLESSSRDIHIIDVRDMVDKNGNTDNMINNKIQDAITNINMGKKIIVCCDYGISRSNAIISGILAKVEKISFNDAVRRVMDSTGIKNIKIEVLSTVRNVIENENIDKIDKIDNCEKRILVIGGSGFIGKTLVPILETKYKTFAPDRKDIDILKDNIDIDILVKELDITHIIHLASPKIYTINSAMGDFIVMLKNILDICMENDIKLIYPSTWEVYSGYNSHYLKASEYLPRFPKGSYGEIKYLCETLLEYYKCRYNLDYALIRSSPVYGNGKDRPKFIFNFIKKAIVNENIITHKYENGFPHLDLLHVEDLTSAFISIIDNDYTGSINIGSGIGISTTDIAKLIIELLNSDSKIKHEDINDYAPNIVMDTSLAQKTFDWKPKIDLKKGLQKIIDNMKIN